MTTEGKRLADIVKRTHKRLRKRYKQGGDEGEVWEDHVGKSAELRAYADAMHALATTHWPKAQNISRVAWVHGEVQRYFVEGARDRITQKELRKLAHLGLVPDAEIDGADMKGSAGRLRLLDVGSCYNPFSVYPEYEVTAIDLCPAHPTVTKCDFLRLQVIQDKALSNAQNEENLTGSIASNTQEHSRSQSHENETTLAESDDANDPLKTEEEAKEELNIGTNTEANSDASLENSDDNKLSDESEKICSLQAGFFDIVIFSLLLEYIPSPKQRYQCCIQAYQLLKHNGLLCIITPDSKHQNANVHLYKLWKITLGFLGFSRVKYEKMSHFHGMVFRKGICSKAWHGDAERELADVRNLNVKRKFKGIDYEKVKCEIYIPQDFQDLSDSEESDECE